MDAAPIIEFSIAIAEKAAKKSIIAIPTPVLIIFSLKKKID